MALAAALLLGAPGPGFPEAHDSVSPPPGAQPVPVEFGMWLLGVSQIDEILNTFRIEADVISSWTDPRLAFDPGPGEPPVRVYQGPAAEEMVSTVWQPLVLAKNAVGTHTTGRRTFTLHADGRCATEVRVQATLRAPLDFRDFPFDRQAFPPPACSR